ncbi:hypothetical protein OESDEN_21232 [Oesophagostomum dentatum]|uniref:Uncharacterized protein n=1 Tax=Oesophagostomum dentatum TaxID=61180 RepID=A0A0B1S7I2_OESDE|nr:hypothetical protein OESDEN_21232 [Oesophagostomum dentatum]
MFHLKHLGWKIEELSCLFVCDFYNYGNNSEALYYETELLGIIGYDVFAKVTRSSVGLWAYGYTDFPKTVNSSLEKTVENYGEYEKQLRKIRYVPLPDPLSTQGAIEAINEMEDSEKVLNCLVFLTAQINTKSLPKLNPRNKEMEKIVVVGLNGTSPKNILPENGAMATVPYYFTEKDINNVVNLIIG